MGLTIRICEDRESHIGELERAFAECPFVSVVRLNKPQDLFYLPRTDALLLTLPYAERWGSRPVVHEAQVLETSLQEREEGMPPYIVTGVAMAPDDPREPPFELHLLITAVLSAVAAFNEQHVGAIRTLAIWGHYFWRDLDPWEAARITKRAYENECTSGGVRTEP